MYGKLYQLLEYYTMFARKIFFPIFFFGGGEGGNCPPYVPRLLCVWQQPGRHGHRTSLIKYGEQIVHVTMMWKPLAKLRV